MEENRTDNSKSSEDISCNPVQQGKEDSELGSLPPFLCDADNLQERAFIAPDDRENVTDAPIPPPDTLNEPPSHAPPGGPSSEKIIEESPDEQIVASSPDTIIPDNDPYGDEIPSTPPADIIHSSTQMILGIDPAQPVLMPGRPALSPEDEDRINKYRKFQKVDGAAYRRVNQFLRKHTYVTAREWAIARLCADFSTRGGAEMTFIGENLPDLVPFMTDTYSPQAVNQARSSFKKKVRKSGATFFYGALCGFFTADELDDILFEASEVARFLLEVEGTSIDIDDEIDIEDRITEVMRGVAEAASRIRNEESGMRSEDTYETEDDKE